METTQLTIDRPKEFTAPKFDHGESEDEEESTVGKLPPNSDDEE